MLETTTFKNVQNVLKNIKKLFVLQLRDAGISQKNYELLNHSDKALLYKKNKKYFLNADARAKIKVGLIGGVFDILHIGHMFTLNEAKKYCDVLVVVVANDTHAKKRGRYPVHSQKYRVAMVNFLKPVDATIFGGKKFKETLARIKPDIIIYGYDQKVFLRPAKIKVIKLKDYIEPERFKSSKIIKRLGL
ncbi:MAG: adenylyltransferase/cytidyltransferase family protein [Candidatus Micrarchaeota archaeon]